MPEKTIRCNNCYTLFEEEDLVVLQDETGDYMHACPHCKTDGYLMNLEKEAVK